MTNYYRYNISDLEEIHQAFDLIDLPEVMDIYADFVIEGIEIVVRKSFINIPGHGQKLYGYLNECRHEYILSFLLDVMDALSDAQETNLGLKDRYVRWHDYVYQVYLRLRQKPVAYEAR